MRIRKDKNKRPNTRQQANKDKLSTDLQGEVGVLTFNPERYRLNPNNFRFITDYIYNLFAVNYTRSLRRICVSLASGLACYLIGLIIAVFIGFARTYVTTPVPYLLPLLTVIVMDRLRWAKEPFADHLNEARETLIIDDERYIAELNKLVRKVNDKRPVLIIYLTSLVIWFVIIAAKYFAPTSFIGRYTNIFIPDTFPPTWFTGPNLQVKMIIAMWLLVIPLLNFAYALYVPATVVFGWHRLVLKWPVVPIPSLISWRFSSFTYFCFRAVVSFAIAVLVIVLAYGGKFEPPLVILATLFAMLGLFFMFFPMLTISQLVNRAREPISSFVLKRYFRLVYPVAWGTASVRENTHSEEYVDTYLELNELQELMNTANGGSEYIYPINLILPIILSQVIPFLGFLYPLLLSR